jgi:hypothetical protein
VKDLKIIGLVVALMATLSVVAQPRLQEPEFYLGIHGGISASTVIFRPATDFMSPINDACTLNGNGGLVFRYAGHKYCAFQMELNYAGHGWREKDPVQGNYYRRLHYLELPILMHLNFGSELVRWFFNAGPMIGYCIKDDGNYGPLLNGETATQYEHIHKPFKWGATGGTGFYIDTPKAGLYQFEVRVNYSLGGIFGTSAADHFKTTSPLDLSINLGWLWPVRRGRH